MGRKMSNMDYDDHQKYVAQKSISYTYAGPAKIQLAALIYHYN